jgi:hypothetical protein
MILVIVLVLKNYAQVQNPSDSIQAAKIPEKDMGDVLHHLFYRHAPLQVDAGLKKRYPQTFLHCPRNRIYIANRVRRHFKR